MDSNTAPRAGHASWANTPDRRARLANAHRNSPIGVEWHARKLFPDGSGAIPPWLMMQHPFRTARRSSKLHQRATIAP